MYVFVLARSAFILHPTAERGSVVRLWREDAQQSAGERRKQASKPVQVRARKSERKDGEERGRRTQARLGKFGQVRLGRYGQVLGAASQTSQVKASGDGLSRVPLVTPLYSLRQWFGFAWVRLNAQPALRSSPHLVATRLGQSYFSHSLLALTMFSGTHLRARATSKRSFFAYAKESSHTLALAAATAVHSPSSRRDIFSRAKRRLRRREPRKRRDYVTTMCDAQIASRQTVYCFGVRA